MQTQSFLILARLTFGVLGLGAILWQAISLLQAGQFTFFNFFGYFTNLSNVVAASILILSAVYLIQTRKPSARDDIIRGAAVLYMAVTGIIYVVLLRNEDLGLLLPWVNTVLHIVMPLAILADWLYQPPLSKLRVSYILWWLLFPVGYLVYTLIRGAITEWYPYPFLNPGISGGYAGVALYVLTILAAFVLLSLAIIRLGNSLKRHA